MIPKPGNSGPNIFFLDTIARLEAAVSPFSRA